MGFSALGYAVEGRGDDRIAFRYDVPVGKFLGKQIQIGFAVPDDFPSSPPSGPHVSPRLLPLNNTSKEHPGGGIHESSSFGDEWEYLEPAVSRLEQDAADGEDLHGPHPEALRDAMRYSAALPSDVHARTAAHLLRGDRQEDLCFALWFPSQGCDRSTALVQDVILPKPGERRVHGNASFEPQFLERAIGTALAANAGLAFLHSHLGPGWQGMSREDVVAEERLAPSVAGATGLPLVGLTLGTDGAGARGSGNGSARVGTRGAGANPSASWATTSL